MFCRLMLKQALRKFEILQKLSEDELIINCRAGADPFGICLVRVIVSCAINAIGVGHMFAVSLICSETWDNLVLFTHFLRDENFARGRPMFLWRH